jgi:hypothetical protein
MTNSEDLAKYIESINGISKPWLLAQLRLKKLEENKPFLSSDEYLIQLQDIQQDVMNLGEWWKTIKN